MSVKYTTDGKKVIYMMDLNDTQAIVKEVFINKKTGEEVFHGENFPIAKSLLSDVPIESYKASVLRKEEEYFDKKTRENQIIIDKLNKEYNIQSVILKEKIAYLKKVNNNELFHKLSDSLEQFLTDKFKYVVMCPNYKHHTLLTIEEFWKDSTYERKLKLFSVYGNDDGTFDFYQHQYYDTSGSKSKIKFFETLEDAKAYIVEIIKSGEYKLTNDSIEYLKSKDIELDSEKHKEFLINDLAYANSNLEISKKNLNRDESRISKINEQINKIK